MIPNYLKIISKAIFPAYCQILHYFHPIVIPFEILHLAADSKTSTGSQRSTESKFSPSEQDKHYKALRECFATSSVDPLISEAKGKSVTINDIINELKYFSSMLPGTLTPQKIIGLDLPDENISQYLQEVHQSVLRIILKDLKNILKYNSEELKDLIWSLFVVDGGNFTVMSNVLKCLAEAVKFTHSPSEAMDFILGILESVVKCDLITSAIVQKVNGDYMDVIQILISIPERVANSTNGKCSEFFVKKFPDALYYHLGNAVKILSYVEENGGDYNLELLSVLFCKTLTRFPKWEGLNNLIEAFECWTESSESMKKIIYNLLLRLNKTSVEAFSLAIFSHCQSPKCVKNILGDLVLNSADFKYVICTKIPFMNFFPRHPRLLFNLIGYLYLVSKDLVFDLFIRVLNVWSDKNSINYTPADQHLFLTEMIILCGGLIQKHLNGEEKFKVRKVLFDGVPVHLESGNEEIRALGMITGEMLIPDFMDVKNQEASLKFDYEPLSSNAKELVQYLRDVKIDDKLNNFTPGDGDEKLKVLMDSPGNVRIDIPTSKSKIFIVEEKTEKNSPDLDKPDMYDIDSDDDLVPYDTSNDVKISKAPQPKYLRDLIEGLADRQNVEKFIACFESAEKIINTQLITDHYKIGIDLIDLFISIDTSYGIENFLSIKYNCCVNIVCIFPAECAEHLCREFNADLSKYSVSDRLFMLDVLSGSARRLSELTEAAEEAKEKSKRKKIEKEWEKVVQDRILSNTRKFITKKSKKVVQNKNHFHQVAGSFFFPLIKDFGVSKLTFSKTRKVDTIKDEILVLTKFLNTIAVITLCSKNAPICGKIVREVMALIWTVRFHEESKIRLAAMSCVGSVFLAAPEVNLNYELLDYVVQYKEWLVNVSRNDPDSNCRGFASQLCLLVIDSV